MTPNLLPEMVVYNLLYSELHGYTSNRVSDAQVLHYASRRSFLELENLANIIAVRRWLL